MNKEANVFEVLHAMNWCLKVDRDVEDRKMKEYMKKGSSILKTKPHILRQFRLKRQISSKELAEQIHVFPEQISRIETGLGECGELMARRLGEYFGVDWRIFFEN